MLKRRPLVEKLFEGRPDDLLVVSGLGSPTWDVSAAGDHAGNFHFIGAMGQAAPFSLGVAIAQPERRVVLVTGDGELLMSLGMLATIGNRAPANLALVVLDNETYAETGGQPTATAGKTDLEAIARACGFESTIKISEEQEVEALRKLVTECPGPVFANVKIQVEKLPHVFPPSFDGVTAINRFKKHAIC